jgi:hypothetical protein
VTTVALPGVSAPAGLFETIFNKEMTMKQRMTKFLNRWLPWRLQRRIEELKKSYSERLEHLLDQKEDLIDSCHRGVLADKERLEKENEKLRGELRLFIHTATTNAIMHIDIARSFINACEKQENGETE